MRAAPPASAHALAKAERRQDLLIALLLGLVVLMAHGGSLHDGLYYDDHWHRATLRDYGWGFTDHVEAATFDLPGPLVELWWQEQPLKFRYARPVAMLLMKLEYFAGGHDPRIVHAFALTWHWLATILVYALARRIRFGLFAAILAATLFATEPQSVFSVSWIAARNALISGVFFLAAAVLYVGPLNTAECAREKPRRGQIVRVCGALGLWLLALFSRETAIGLPLLLPLLDAIRGGWPRVAGRWSVYLTFALAGGAYLYWRLAIFPTVPPPDIYFTRPAGVEFVLWAGVKLLHMVFALFVHTPMLLGVAAHGGISASEWLPIALMAALLGVLAAWYLFATRRQPDRWLAPAWIGLALAPVIPVFLMPHFAYLPAVGSSLVYARLISSLRGWGRWIAAGAILALGLWSFGLYRYVWRGIVRSEQLIYADIRENSPRADEGTHLFFINLPITGIYAAVAMREAWGVSDLAGHVLTGAPHPLMRDRGCVVEVVGDYELRVSSEPPGYFSGAAGQMLLAGTRPDKPLRSGDVIPGEHFDCTILEADERGATRLMFGFHERLDSPWYRFYVCTSERPAQWLNFAADPGALSPDDAALFERMLADDIRTRRRARREFQLRAAPLAVQTASLEQSHLASLRELDEDGLERVADWWRRIDGPALERQNDTWRRRYADGLAERATYFRIFEATRRLVRSDVYLTGD